MYKRRAHMLVIAVLVAFGLVAAACGGGDDDSSSDDTSAAEDDSTTGADSAEPTEAADDAADGAANGAEPTEATDDGATVPSVEPISLKIGIAFPDLEAFATLNPAFGIGDPEEQALAVLDGWIRNGLLPEGLEIELVTGKYNIISDDAKLGVCTSLAQDDEVFAAVSGRDFTVGANCLTERFQIPVIDTNSAQDSTYARGAPWFFTLRTSQTAQLRSFVEWADAQGMLEGKTIGLYYETRLDEAVAVMKEELSARGYEIASEVSTSGEGVGSPQDQIVVQKFQADGVDLALLFVGGSSAINVLSSAEDQGYTPSYLDLDYGEHTTDVAAKTFPASQYDGTLAMTITRIGELGAGSPLTPEAEACVTNYERYSGAEISRVAPETGEFSNILLTCDLMSVLLAGLQGAGPVITKESFVAAVEGITNLAMAGNGTASFGPDDHSGVDEYRTIQWDAACPCWKAVDDFQPVSQG